MAESMKALVNKRITKEFKFMGVNVKISKLTVAEVMAIQEKAKSLETDNGAGLDVLKTVIRASVEGATDLSDDDFANFPMDELSTLSNEIMRFSGIVGEQGK